MLVGWKKPVEIIDPATHEEKTIYVRIFRRLDLWIPRKNGKSEFLAALAVLFFVLEKIQGAQAYVFARDEKQALIPFNKMVQIIEAADGLREDRQGNERITINAKNIYLRETASLCQLLTGSPKGKHGKSPTVTVGDEIHEWKSTEIADTLRQGTGTRLQPIELYASTAGRRQDRIGFDWFKESMEIVEGVVDDPSTFVVYFGIAEDDDWTDEAIWRKANPSLGLTPTIDHLRAEAKKAKGRPAKEAVFQCYHLNRWVDDVAGWIPRSKWDACCAKPGSWRDFREENKGRRAFLATDISAKRDITALVAVLPPDETHEKWIVIPRFWIPEETLDVRAEDDKRVNWHHWIETGALETTPGDFVDQGIIQDAIEDAFRWFDVEMFGYDPWNASKLVGDLQKSGLDPEMMQEIRQGHQSMSGPTTEFEGLVFSGNLDHGGHPVLAWMAGHCSIRFNVNLNYVPDKKHSRDKIDGIVAAVMAVGLASKDFGVSLDVDAMVA
ncbi:terminase large subunit [Martelella soudanensis]|uniref:terminase large subunit n=1 Tax=unclassified Martelella TaxID=2629616 RepID=UPI001FF0253B|nr:MULTISPECIES: terminase TerL endonuclease subunit [unclassified Martelella]